MWRGQVLLAIALSTLVPSKATGTDLTQEYLAAHRSECSFSAAHIEVLRRHKVLFVPGYFSDLDPAYFTDQSNWLASIGVQREKIAVKSRQSASINAPIIATTIRDSGKPVILITHSKGSMDTLEALRAEPSLRTKVKGWVSLQGAFFGSPVADMALDGAQLNPLMATVILGYFGGSKESAQSLTTVSSLAYYRDNKTMIDAVVREVPAVALTTAIDSESGTQARTILGIPHALMWNKGIRNDGLLPMEAAVLPGMSFVKISGVDHIAPVMPAAQHFDRVRMTKALLLLALGMPFRNLPRDVNCRAAN
jgi:hypothetical protein